MREITKIILHNSDSDNPAHDDISVIDRWHKERGWKGVGYHWFITSKGKLQYGRPIGDIGSHVLGHNRDSLGICLHGRDKFHPAQFGTLRKLLESINFVIRVDKVYGHRDFDSGKTCPNFDYKTILGYDNYVEREVKVPNALKHLLK